MPDTPRKPSRSFASPCFLSVLPALCPGFGRSSTFPQSIRTRRESSSDPEGGAMEYQIQRGDQKFGPYTLAELQQYVQEGRVLLTDLAQSEGMTDWVPVSQ